MSRTACNPTDWNRQSPNLVDRPPKSLCLLLAQPTPTVTTEDRGPQGGRRFFPGGENFRVYEFTLKMKNQAIDKSTIHVCIPFWTPNIPTFLEGFLKVKWQPDFKRWPKPSIFFHGFWGVAHGKKHGEKKTADEPSWTTKTHLEYDMNHESSWLVHDGILIVIPWGIQRPLIEWSVRKRPLF